MKAVVLDEYGDASKLHYKEVPDPEPHAYEVLVTLAATSINPVDWKVRSGAAKDRMPLTFPAILGRDVAGEITKVGSNVTDFRVGQKVMALGSQSYAELVVAKVETLTLIPEGMSMEQAGAIPLVTLTGAQLIQHMRPKAGETVLVTGAVGNVGRTAVYMAKEAGARVIAGVRENQKKDAESLGADQIAAIDVESEISSLPQLDGIADTVDHDVIAKLLPKLKSGGVLGSVLGKPKEAEGRDIRIEAFMAQADTRLLGRLALAVRDGKLKIPIARKFKLSEAAEAQKLAEKGSMVGKIVLLP